MSLSTSHTSSRDATSVVSHDPTLYKGPAQQDYLAGPEWTAELPDVPSRTTRVNTQCHRAWQRLDSRDRALARRLHSYDYDAMRRFTCLCPEFVETAAAYPLLGMNDADFMARGQKYPETVKVWEGDVKNVPNLFPGYPGVAMLVLLRTMSIRDECHLALHLFAGDVEWSKDLVNPTTLIASCLSDRRVATFSSYYNLRLSQRLKNMNVSVVNDPVVTLQGRDDDDDCGPEPPKKVEEVHSDDTSKAAHLEYQRRKALTEGILAGFAAPPRSLLDDFDFADSVSREIDVGFERTQQALLAPEDYVETRPASMHDLSSPVFFPRFSRIRQAVASAGLAGVVSAAIAAQRGVVSRWTALALSGCAAAATTLSIATGYFDVVTPAQRAWSGMVDSVAARAVQSASSAFWRRVDNFSDDVVHVTNRVSKNPTVGSLLPYTAADGSQFFAAGVPNGHMLDAQVTSHVDIEAYQINFPDGKAGMYPMPAGIAKKFGSVPITLANATVVENGSIQAGLALKIGKVVYVATEAKLEVVAKALAGLDLREVFVMWSSAVAHGVYIRNSLARAVLSNCRGDPIVALVSVINRALPPDARINLSSNTKVLQALVNIMEALYVLMDDDRPEYEGSVDYMTAVGVISEVVILFSSSTTGRAEYVNSAARFIAIRAREPLSSITRATIAAWNKLFPGSIKCVVDTNTNRRTWETNSNELTASVSGVCGMLSALLVRYMVTSPSFDLVLEANLTPRELEDENMIVQAVFAANRGPEIDVLQLAVRNYLFTPGRTSLLTARFGDFVPDSPHAMSTLQNVLRTHPKIFFDPWGDPKSRHGAGWLTVRDNKPRNLRVIREALSFVRSLSSERADVVQNRDLMSLLYRTSMIVQNRIPLAQAIRVNKDPLSLAEAVLAFAPTSYESGIQLASNEKAHAAAVRKLATAVVTASKADARDISKRAIESAIADDTGAGAAASGPATFKSQKDKSAAIAAVGGAAASGVNLDTRLPAAASGVPHRMGAPDFKQMSGDADRRNEDPDPYAAHFVDDDDDDSVYDSVATEGITLEAYLAMCNAATSANIPAVFNISILHEGAERSTNTRATAVSVPSLVDDSSYVGLLIPLDFCLGTRVSDYAKYKNAQEAGDAAFDRLFGPYAVNHQVSVERLHVQVPGHAPDVRRQSVKFVTHGPRLAYIGKLTTTNETGQKVHVYAGAIFAACESLTQIFGKIPKFTINGRDLLAASPATAREKVMPSGFTTDGLTMASAVLWNLTNQVQVSAPFYAHGHNTGAGDCGSPFFNKTHVFGVHVASITSGSLTANVLIGLHTPTVHGQTKVSLEAAVGTHWADGAMGAFVGEDVLAMHVKYQNLPSSIATIPRKEAITAVAAPFRRYFMSMLRPDDAAVPRVMAFGSNVGGGLMFLNPDDTKVCAEAEHKKKIDLSDGTPEGIAAVTAAMHNLVREMRQTELKAGAVPIEEWQSDKYTRRLVFASLAFRLARNASAGALFEVYKGNGDKVFGDKTSRGFMHLMASDYGISTRFLDDCEACYAWLLDPAASGCGVMHLFGKGEPIPIKKIEANRYREIRMPVIYVTIVQTALASFYKRKKSEVAKNESEYSPKPTGDAKTVFESYMATQHERAERFLPLRAHPWVDGWASLDEEMAATRGLKFGWFLGGHFPDMLHNFVGEQAQAGQHPKLCFTDRTQCVSNDVSAWDGSLPDELVTAFFGAVTGNPAVARNLFRVNCKDAYVVTKCGRIFETTHTRRGNWPSGNIHTLSGNTLMHAAILRAAGVERYLVQGDDSVVFDVTDVVAKEAYSRIGMTLKEHVVARGEFEFCKVHVKALPENKQPKPQGWWAKAAKTPYVSTRTQFQLSSSLAKSLSKTGVYPDAVIALISPFDSVDKASADYLGLFEEGSACWKLINEKIAAPW